MSDETFKDWVDTIINDLDIKVKKVYNTLGLTKPTWYRKKNDPDTFTVAEIFALAEVLGRTPEEVFKEIVKGKKGKNV